MTKPKETNIKKIYHDVLYWAISPLSKDKPYHLTKTEEAVLRKLIHYDNKNSVIRYSNLTIGKHIFMKETYLEKLIPVIRDKGYITALDYTISNKKNGIIKRRVININWDFIKEIMADIPEIESNEKKEELADEELNGSNVLPITDNHNEQVTNQAENKEAMTPIQVSNDIGSNGLTNGFKIIDAEEDVNHCPIIGQSIIDSIKMGKEFTIEKVNLKFGEGDYIEAEVIQIPNSKQFYLKDTLLRIDSEIFNNAQSA